MFLGFAVTIPVDPDRLMKIEAIHFTGRRPSKAMVPLPTKSGPDAGASNPSGDSEKGLW